MVIGVLWASAIVTLEETARSRWGDEGLDLLPGVYLGSASTIRGTMIGSLGAFAEAFVCAYSLVRLYNRIQASENHPDYHSWT